MNKHTQNTQTRPHPADASPIFAEEAEHLQHMLALVDDALRAAAADLDDADRAYMEAKRYMVENRGEIDPNEMFQNELGLAQLDRSGAFQSGVHVRLATLRRAPYFARIDFKESGEPEAEAYYIGPFSFRHAGRFHIFDWRAPLAGMFYDNALGPAAYDAPAGSIAGILTRKRQLGVKAGALQYALESGDHVPDSMLQMELSRTSDERTKSIIATIGREQNAIIRRKLRETLIIEGVAGSGKTSIALHRIAYLLYHFPDRLHAGNIAILSPSPVFSDFIAGVLPELGEEPARTLHFADLVKAQLEGVCNCLPPAPADNPPDDGYITRLQFKSTSAFAARLGEYLARLPERVFTPADYIYEGFTVPGEWIGSRFAAYSRHAVGRRLDHIAADILERLHTENIRGGPLPTQNAIRKTLSGMTGRHTTLSLYRNFYRECGLTEFFVMPGKDTLEWPDGAPFLLVHAAFAGLRESGEIRHLVIDEMQDYSPVQFLLIKTLFPCSKTILGDFSQSIGPGEPRTLEDLQHMFPDAQTFALYKSYRSTYEIISFAGLILPGQRLEPFSRHGDAPCVLPCGDEAEQHKRVSHALDTFLQGTEGTLALLTKEEKDAQRWLEFLSARFPVHLLSSECRRFPQGITIAPIALSKGLEFDAVLLPDADGQTYKSAHDRRLLFVACTRALHRLTITCVGTPSPLLPPAD